MIATLTRVLSCSAWVRELLLDIRSEEKIRAQGRLSERVDLHWSANRLRAAAQYDPELSGTAHCLVSLIELEAIPIVGGHEKEVDLPCTLLAESRQLSCEFHLFPEIGFNTTFLFILNRYQSSEVLSMEFPHNLLDPGDPAS